MTRSSRSVVAVVTCLALVVSLSSPALAGNGTLSTGDTLDDGPSGDDLAGTTDATDDGSVDDGLTDATSDRSTVTDSSGDTDTADGTDGSGLTANGNATVTVGANTSDVSNGTVDATADTGLNVTASTNNSTVSVSSDGDLSATAGTDGDSLDLDTTLNTSVTVDDETLAAAATVGDRENRVGGTPTPAPTTDEPEQATETTTAAADTGSGAATETPAGASGAVPGGRTGTTLAVGAVVVGGLAVARRGFEVAGHTPPVDVRTAAAVATDWARLRLPAFFPFGYSRYDDSDPLEHDARAALYDSIEAEPGVNLTTLAEETTVSLSTVRHHLRILEAESLVETECHNGKRRYFPAGTEDTALLAALDDRAKRTVLRAVADREPATVSELAAALDRDPSTVSHHLSNLEDDGIVRRERDGQAVLTRIAPDVRTAIDSAGAAPADSTAD